MNDLVLNGRYKLLERTGSGGMSIVYRAADLSLGRTVAIKMLHESLTGDEGFLERFQREAHAVANLTHPNIVTVHDIGQDGYHHYMVMEFVDGRTLKAIVRGLGKQDQIMPVARALDLAIQICAGIGYAHRASLVHCDVKPQNILVTRDDRVKVTDFGIAQAMSEATRHQLDGEIWGTPQYFAPEQAAGQRPTPASDVYAIGVVLYEMLSGRLPFEADSHTALALMHMREVPPLVSDLNPAVPAQLEQIVQKIMSKEPAGRYRTADQLGRILESYMRGSQAATGPVPPVRQYPGAVGAAALATVIDTAPVTSFADGGEPSGPLAYSTKSIFPAEDPETLLVPVPANQGLDWKAVLLGIVALLFLLGLIPLWYYVYSVWAG